MTYLVDYLKNLLKERVGAIHGAYAESVSIFVVQSIVIIIDSMDMASGYTGFNQWCGLGASGRGRLCTQRWGCVFISSTLHRGNTKAWNHMIQTIGYV